MAAANSLMFLTKEEVDQFWKSDNL